MDSTLKMLLFYSWIFSSLYNVNALEPARTSSCAAAGEHEESTLLQGWATPKAKPRPVILTHAMQPDAGLIDDNRSGANATVSKQVSASQAATDGVISIKLDSELQLSAVQAVRSPTAAPILALPPMAQAAMVSGIEALVPVQLLGFAVDLVKASAADTSPHPTGTEATLAPGATSRTAQNPAGMQLALSDSSFPALVHETALAQFDLYRAFCQKYDPWRSDALMITMMIIFLSALCAGIVMCCMSSVRSSTAGSASTRLNAPTWGSYSATSRSRLPSPQEPIRHPSPAFSPHQPEPGLTTFGSPAPTGLDSQLHSSPYLGARTSSLNAELVLPPDKEVLLAVPSLALTPPGDKPLEHPIANKDGSPILRASMTSKLHGGSVCEHLAIFLWEDNQQLAYCEIWPQKLKVVASQSSMQDAVVGSIFRGTGELYANIIRHFSPSGGGGLPIGEFLVSSPSGPQWQHRMQSRGRDLMVVDMSGHPHGMVMSGVDLSFENFSVQYYQLHALAGTDVCLLLMTVMAIDRLTILSKE